jgi:hypothetical protein
MGQQPQHSIWPSAYSCCSRTSRSIYWSALQKGNTDAVASKTFHFWQGCVTQQMWGICRLNLAKYPQHSFAVAQLTA